jgi:hypothetical protein
MEEKSTIRQGWQCPKCQSIMSPDTNHCVFCISLPKTIVVYPLYDNYMIQPPAPYNPLFGPLYSSVSFSTNDTIDSSITKSYLENLTTLTAKSEIEKFWEDSYE